MPISALLLGMSILIIGDSHMAKPDHLLNALHDRLSLQGAIVHSIGVCGSIPGDWISGAPGKCGKAERLGKASAKALPKSEGSVAIKGLLEKEHPDLILVVQGDTLGSYDKAALSKSWLRQQVSGLTKEIAISGTRCIWVGPAWGSEGGTFKKTFERVEQLSKILESTVAPCSYLDSLKLSKPGAWAALGGQRFTPLAYQS